MSAGLGWGSGACTNLPLIVCLTCLTIYILGTLASWPLAFCQSVVVLWLWLELKGIWARLFIFCQISIIPWAVKDHHHS